MTYVLVMSTDTDIRGTQLNSSWDPIDGSYNWDSVRTGASNVPSAATIVVVAHGNDNLIGNEGSGVDIDPKRFLELVQTNVQGPPEAIYISTCGQGIAQFAAGVRLAANSQQLWNNTKIFGHSDPVEGKVPPSSNLSWYQIF